MGIYFSKCWGRGEDDKIDEQDLSQKQNRNQGLINNQMDNKGGLAAYSQIIDVNDNPVIRYEKNKENQNENYLKKIPLKNNNLLEIKSKELEDKEKNLKQEEKKINEIKTKNEEHQITLNKLEEALNKREKDLEIKEISLASKEENINKKQEELNKGESGLTLKRENLNKKEEDLNKKEKELNQRESDISPKELDLNQRETNLNQREKDLVPREEKLVKREDELNQRENGLTSKEDNLNQKENSLIPKENDLNKKEENLKQREENLKKEEENLKERESSLSKKEEDLNIKDEELKRRDQEIINIKAKEDKDLSEKREAIINQEKLLKEKEDNLNQRETELTQNQTRLDQDKMLQEDQMKQREDSLKQLQLKLDQEKQYIEKRRKELLPTEIGLQNIGATCYMNATLQALSNTDKFTEYFLDKYPKIQNNSNKKMSDEMYKVLFNLWDEDKKKGDYPPYDFKNALSEENSLFAGVQANDSKDLINFLLERFHHELNEPNSQTSNQNMIVNQMDEMQTLNAFFVEYFSANKSIITDLFYGIVETRSRCGGCGCTKYNFQIFSFLEFPLKEVNTFMFNNGRRMSLINQDGTNPDINLYECFDYYQKIDLMNGQNQMYCNICNFNRDTYYGSTLYSLPNFLIINLNRGKGAVYQCNVKFPETLNLLNYVTNKDKTVLQLYAVICHYGPSSMSGHFIAYCKHRKTKKWYQYNDSTVTECTQPNEYNNGMPYILFYQAI